MIRDKLDLTVYLVTDRPSVNLTFERLLEKVEQSCKGGIGVVQLREKELSTKEYIDMAKRMLAVTRKYGVPLVVDDRVDVALAAGADGAHVGQDDISAADARRILGKAAIIGVTAKSVKQAQSAERDGADYIGTGAIFEPTVKVKTHRTSIEELGVIAGSVKIPTVAISGINRGNIAELRGSPIAGVAVIAAILEAEDSELETRLLKAAVLENIAGVGLGDGLGYGVGAVGGSVRAVGGSVGDCASASGRDS